MELRKLLLLLPLDDLLVVARAFVCPELSRSALDRCLRHHGVARLADLLPVAWGKLALPKILEDREPGFVHVNVKYLPEMPDEAEHRHPIVAIDRARKPTGQHASDRTCAHHVHRPSADQAQPPANQWHDQALRQPRRRVVENHPSAKHLETTLQQYLHLYNQYILQKKFGHVTSVAKLNEYYRTKPTLFHKGSTNTSGTRYFT